MNNRGVILLLSALAALLLLAACGTADFTPAQQCLRGAAVPDGPAAAQPADAGGEILVRYRAGGADRSLQAAGLSRSHGLKVLEQGTGNMPDLVLADGDALETADRLMTDPRVAWAVPNWRLQTLGGADCHAEQWNLAEFGAAAAWGRGPGRHRVTVAVIDSGIDTDHPALADAMLPGFNFFDMTTDPRPATTADHHGTHVAGIIAAHGEGPVTGIAAFPANIRIVPIRIFDDTGADASFSDLLRALTWAAGGEVPGTPLNEHPADIINLSLGAAVEPHAGVSAAIRETVTSQGIAVVAAAGNDITGTFPTGIHAPANSGEAFAIGSVDSDFRRSYFSAYGGPVSLSAMAPGGFGPSSCGTVLSTMPDSGHGCEAGTSMAAPFVSGALALLLTREPRLSPEQLERRLELASWFDRSWMTAEEYGPGILCADRLLGGLTLNRRGRC